MSIQDHGLSNRSLAELALVISRVARSMLDESAYPSTPSLRSFWHSCRSLEHRWIKILDDWTLSGTSDPTQLEYLAPRVFTCEMTVRTWCTVLATLDTQRGSKDLTLIARNAVNGLTHVRNGILSRLLILPRSFQNRVLEIDRMRRRCDRWTDLLLGTLAINGNCFEFAFDEARARDFGEDGLQDFGTKEHPIEQMISAGLRLTFLQHLTTEPIDEPELLGLTQSILSSIPHRAFYRDGTLRSLLEQQIVASRLRLERRAKLSQHLTIHESCNTTNMSGGHFRNLMD